MNQSEPPEERRPSSPHVRAARYLMTLAVLAIFVGATVLLFDGIIEMGHAVWRQFSLAQAEVTDSVSLRVAVIEAVDVILVATVLYVNCFWPISTLCRPSIARHVASLAAHLYYRQPGGAVDRHGHHGAEHHRVDPSP